MRILRFALLGLLCLCCVDETRAALPLGRFDYTSSAVSCGPSGQTCRNFAVSLCDQVTPVATGILRTGSATGSSLGAIVFFTGFGGGAWWEDFGGPNGQAHQVITDLRNAGFTTVQVKWSSPGWLQTKKGQRSGQEKLACRPATVVNQVYTEHVGSGKLLCGTGNSAGSSALTYMLTSFAFDLKFNAVVLTSGPVFSREDFGCLDAAGTTYAYTDAGRNEVDKGYGYLTDGQGPCFLHDASFTSIWQQNSHDITDPNDDYFYLNTFVGFLFGALDTGSAPDHGTLFYNRLVAYTNPHLSADPNQNLVPNTPHELPSTTEGATAVENMLLGQCHVQP